MRAAKPASSAGASQRPGCSSGAALLLLLHSAAAFAFVGAAAAASVPDQHAVIVSSSRYWLNYRHVTNALGVYQAIRRLGVPDSNIVLMLADTVACDPRNGVPGQIASGAAGAPANLYSPDIEVDYSGREVSVASLLGVLTGRQAGAVPAGRRLASGANSSVLLFLTGHGGDEFLKFHDQEELLAADLANAVHQMWAARRYGRMLMVVDTCQASTLYGRVSAPNFLAIASSKLGQSSYAHHSDGAVGLHITDQFSFHLETFLLQQAQAAEAVRADAKAAAAAAAAGGASPVQRAMRSRRAKDRSSSGASGGGGGSGAGATLQQMLDFIRSQPLSSDVMVRSDLFPRPLSEVRVSEFFGPGASFEAGGGGGNSGGSGSRGGGSVLPEPAGGSDASALEAAARAWQEAEEERRRQGRQSKQHGEQQQEGEEEQDQPQDQRQQPTLAELLEGAGGWAAPPAARPAWQWAVVHAAGRLGLAPRELLTLALCAAPLLALRWWQRRRPEEAGQPSAGIKAAAVVAAAAAALS